MTTPNTDVFKWHKAEFEPRTEDKVFQEFSERLNFSLAEGFIVPELGVNSRPFKKNKRGT